MSATNGTYICLLLFRFQCLILTYMFIYVHKYSQAFMFDCKKIKVKFHIFMCLYVIHERIHVIKFDLLISSFLICWFEIRLLSSASSVWMEIINIQSATQTLGRPFCWKYENNHKNLFWDWSNSAFAAHLIWMFTNNNTYASV